MFSSLANDVICRAALGRKFTEEGSGKKFLNLLREFSELLANLSVGEFILWLSWIDRVSGFKARVDKVAKELDVFLEEVIQGCLNAGQDLSGKAVQNASTENFLDILTTIYKDKTTGVSIHRDSIKGILVVKIALYLYMSIYLCLSFQTAWSIKYYTLIPQPQLEKEY